MQSVQQVSLSSNHRESDSLNCLTFSNTETTKEKLDLGYSTVRPVAAEWVCPIPSSVSKRVSSLMKIAPSLPPLKDNL